MLVELLLRDPHRLERGEGCVDRPSEPGGILALWILNDFGAVIWRSELVHLAPQALGDIREQGVSTRQHNVFEELPPNRLVTLHD